MARKPTVVRGEVQPQSTPGAYREELRRDFWFSCGYCTLSEREASGIGFQIDHYEPESMSPGRRNDYSNLIYACESCNRKKLDWVPADLDLSRASALRYFRPDWEHEDDHFEVSLDGEVRPRTPIGTFTVEVLELYRARMVAVRKERASWLAFDRQRRRVVNGLRALRELSLDELPPKLRARLQKARDSVGDEHDALDAAVLTGLRELGRSAMLDPEPRAVPNAKRRKAYVKRVGAVRARSLNKAKTAAARRTVASAGKRKSG